MREQTIGQQRSSDTIKRRPENCKTSEKTLLAVSYEWLDRARITFDHRLLRQKSAESSINHLPLSI